MSGPFGAQAHAQEFSPLDVRHFDTLARALSAGSSRRHVLGALAGLPVLGGLAGILSPEDAEGHGRRKRRKKRHKHGKGRRRTKPKHKKKQKQPDYPTCIPPSRAQTCAGTCGEVVNTCGVVVDCGPCPCSPTCPACQSCDPATRQCVADASQEGEACGAPGQVCQADGTCACTPITTCPAGADCGEYPDGCGGFVTCPTTCDNPTPICTDNICGPCTADSECASSEICSEGQCVTGSGTCAAGANVCTAPGFDSPCDGNPDCFCIPTLAGATRCAQYYATEQGFLRPCTSDAECADLGPGAFCPQPFDSCGGVCSLPCPTA
jgi:hypothetical protein